MTFLYFLTIPLATPKPFSDNVIDMVAQSGLFSKIILLILLAFSISSWAIIFNKWRVFAKIGSETEKFLYLFHKKGRISEVYLNCTRLKDTPLSFVLGEGYKELQNFVGKEQNPLNQEKLDIIKMVLDKTGADELDKLETRTVFLATVANTSPFLGLLGTVWGVMDSFASIGVKGTASLAVVAPGIAEALIATIFGLAVAIPAVIGYNHFNYRLKVVSSEIDKFILEFMVKVKKEYSL
ncbi:MAG TPA: MotA/TolQ/ExbB proton channel family protein [candidate division Zixibacteria bacterium]